VGASYVALECAGFLHGLGYDVTVAVRSILLRGFDQEIAEKIGKFMEEDGVKFRRHVVPTKLEQIEAGAPGRIGVTLRLEDGQEVTDEFNTVLFAIGRNPCTSNIGAERIGLKLNQKNGKVLVNDREETNISNIYAIGDIADGKPELTPVAIEAGHLLSQRLFNNGTTLTDYLNVPTTVFTPLEYGSVGYSEESAVTKYGADEIEVWHQELWPSEWTVPQRPRTQCFAKLITVLKEDERVVGFHFLGPNAGEVTQMAALALKLGATKSNFDRLIGIHPTCAEVFTLLDITKRSGKSPALKACCG
jgi:thioredoxin reductase (NADPH)